MQQVQVMQPKKREEIFFKGKKGLPLLVFIHGMGMNASAWADPAKARVLGGAYLLSALFRGSDAELLTSFQDLKALGYNILTWTQSRPAGPIHIAVSELRRLLKEYHMHAGDGIIFICHSRGGLIARKYLQEGGLSAKALITLATPHRGTTMARWATFFQPFTAAIDTLLRGFSSKEVDSAFRRVIAFLGSSGLQELLPGSGFYRDLNDRRSEGSVYISVGGTDPDLLSPVGFPIAEFMSRVVPGRMVPEELREGQGDGLVSAASAVLPHADEHRDFHLNHVAMLFDKEVRTYVAKKVMETSG
jgi:pimeloyl-ACP methyl ester carboxylesterase